METRLARNETATRLEAKASKRDVAASRARLLEAEEKWQFRPVGDFPLEPHLFIDNSTLSPQEVAASIADAFDLR